MATGWSPAARQRPANRNLYFQECGATPGGYRSLINVLAEPAWQSDLAGTQPAPLSTPLARGWGVLRLRLQLMAQSRRWDEAKGFAKKAAALGDGEARAMCADLRRRVERSRRRPPGRHHRLFRGSLEDTDRRGHLDPLFNVIVSNWSPDSTPSGVERARSIDLRLAKATSESLFSQVKTESLERLVGRRSGPPIAAREPGSAVSGSAPRLTPSRGYGKGPTSERTLATPRTLNKVVRPPTQAAKQSRPSGETGISLACSLLSPHDLVPGRLHSRSSLPGLPEYGEGKGRTFQRLPIENRSRRRAALRPWVVARRRSRMPPSSAEGERVDAPSGTAFLRWS